MDLLIFIYRYFDLFWKNLIDWKQSIKKNILQDVMDWMFVSPLNSYVEILIPKVMVSGDGAFL